MRATANLRGSVRWLVSINRTSDVRLDHWVFSNRRPDVRLGSILVEMKEDAELLDPSTRTGDVHILIPSKRQAS